MKKYIFIFSTQFELVISSKKDNCSSNLYEFYMNLIAPFINFENRKNLYEINFSLIDTIKEKLVARLKFLLEQRKNLPLASEQSEWKGRFTERQMFNSKLIFGIEYNLYIGGIDNEIFWLASFTDLIDNSINNKISLFVYFNDKIIDIDRMQKTIKLLCER